MIHKMDSNKFVERINELHPTVNLTSDFIDWGTRISYHCECGYDGDATPVSIQERGCRACTLRKIGKEPINESVIRTRLNALHPTLVFGCMSGTGHRGKVSYTCTKCGHEGEKSIQNAVYSNPPQGCSKCFKSAGGIGGLNQFSEEKLKTRGVTGGRFYVAHLTNESGVDCYKSGITTQSFAKRAMNFRHLSQCKVEKVYEIFAVSHSDLVLIESIFKQTHKDSRYDWEKKWFGSAECFVFDDQAAAIAAAEAAVGHALRLIEEIG